MDKKQWKAILIGDFSWRRVLRSFLEIYACILVWAWFGTDRLIFVPPPSGYTEDASHYRIPVNADEKLGVWGFTNSAAPYVVLYCHGNAEDISMIQPIVEDYSSIGLSAYTFDYRGYGISDGKPSTRHAYQDANAVIQHLIHDKGIPSERIIVHGRSLGAAMAIELAAHYKVAGLIVESGFVTAFRVRTVIPIAPFDKMRNNHAIQKVKCPVLVMHGEADQTIPTWHGKKLFALAPEPKLAYWVPGAGHDDLEYVAGPEYWLQIQKFLGLVGDKAR